MTTQYLISAVIAAATFLSLLTWITVEIKHFNRKKPLKVANSGFIEGTRLVQQNMIQNN